jgi:ribose transport system substrate-binding protein
MRGHGTRLVNLLTLAAALATAFLASCEKAYHQENERYIFVASNITLPYWQEAAAGFKDAAVAAGVKSDFTGPDTYSPDEELDAFQKAVDRHPSGILVAPARADKFTSAIDAAVKGGIPVICIDSDAPDSLRVLFIGTDNYRAGQESGNHMGQLLHGQGNVVIIAIPGQLNQDERIRGAKEALAGYTRIKVTQTLDDKGDPRSANDQISALLEKKEKIDGILCLEASGGPGSAEALHRLGTEGKMTIVAFDRNPETMDWIASGVIAGTTAQKPYTMAYYGLRFLDDLHHNIVHEFKDWRTAPASPLPTRVDTGTAWIDKSNIEAFKAAEATRLKQIGGPVQPTTQ